MKREEGRKSGDLLVSNMKNCFAEAFTKKGPSLGTYARQNGKVCAVRSSCCFEGVRCELTSSWPPARVEVGSEQHLMTPLLVNPLNPLNPVQCAKIGFGSKRSSKSRGLGSPGGLNKTKHEWNGPRLVGSGWNSVKMNLEGARKLFRYFPDLRYTILTSILPNMLYKSGNL